MKRIATDPSTLPLLDMRFLKIISLIACLTIIGTLFVNNAKAQCSLSTLSNVGTSPYIRVATPSSASITTTSATVTDVWGAWNSMFPAVVTIEYGTTSGSYTSSITYTQAAYNSGTGTIAGGTGTFTACNCGTGTSTGTFNANLTGLASSTTYYYRARINGGGNCVYSAEQSFTTLNAGPFTISTTAASSVTGTSASTGGTITPTGAVTVTQRGVAYGTTINPTTAGTKLIDGSATTGTFTSNLTGLTSSTTYYVRAYVIGSDGITYYGPQQTFTTLFQVSGIISPFSLTPAWYFGNQAKYTFPSGSFPAVPPGPAIGTNATNNQGIETSTSVSFRTGGVAAYTNSMQAWNSANTQLRNFVSDGTCAGSSTGGGVSFPDPARDAQNDAFYLILGNDTTGGSCANSKGASEYRLSGTSSLITTSTGKPASAFEINTFATEAITAGTDGTGGYWVVIHDIKATNKFHVWHYTSSGKSGPVEYTPATTATIDATTSSGYLKFSPCMNMIAWAGFAGKEITVYNFDRTTGAVGTQIARKAVTAEQTSGLEFSPDGTKIFYSGQGLQISWFLISNPATGGTIAGSASWTMQMGPDAQIYTSGIGSNPNTFGTANVGRITDPNGAATYTNMTLTGGALVYRGLTNLAWLSPQTPTLSATASSCDVNFKYSFLNYFNDTVTTNSIEWSWDNGTTWTPGTNPQSHTFANGTTYNVRVRFRDNYCSQLWTNAPTSTGTVSCALPVSWLNVSATGKGYSVWVNWGTSAEKNNAYFIIERSGDGKTFSPIGQVNGALNSSTMQQYQFIDNQPNNGVNYYRVVQYDVNNNSSYSDVVESTQSNFGVTIAPNPSQKDFHLKIYTHEEEVMVMVTDLLGREIYINNTSDFNDIHFGENFAKGTYIVKVLSGQEIYTQKIVKE